MPTKETLVRIVVGISILMTAAGLASCKRTLHTTMIQEKIDERVRRAAVPPGFEKCVEFGSCGVGAVGCSKVEVEVLEQDGYSGVARVRARIQSEQNAPVCEQEMEFVIVPADPPAGHRGRGSSSMDPAYWSLEKLARRGGAPSP
jgi:hypothetical protein